jgi:hypothetical protein
VPFHCTLHCGDVWKTLANPLADIFDLNRGERSERECVEEEAVEEDIVQLRHGRLDGTLVGVWGQIGNEGAQLSRGYDIVGVQWHLYAKQSQLAQRRHIAVEARDTSCARAASLWAWIGAADRIAPLQAFAGGGLEGAVHEVGSIGSGRTSKDDDSWAVAGHGGRR